MLFYPFTFLPFYLFTLLLFYPFAFLPFYLFTFYLSKYSSISFSIRLKGVEVW